ncbi:unnamed protein product [Nesidiocoris tenuis]|uniref:Uncharacterized protein n=1 Tax=Nesidiocoris tenuis TaxID=355587 RepID=A0A6H5GRW1_9HEMI|nr:unnamed protein product [Nesidiocoris tenuis]
MPSVVVLTVVESDYSWLFFTKSAPPCKLAFKKFGVNGDVIQRSSEHQPRFPIDVPIEDQSHTQDCSSESQLPMSNSSTDSNSESVSAFNARPSPRPSTDDAERWLPNHLHVCSDMVF